MTKSKPTYPAKESFRVIESNPQDTLTGLFFHSVKEDKKTVQYQGVIIRKVTDMVYAALLFDWALGDPSIVRLFHLKEMMNWHFYMNNDDMLFQYEHCNNGLIKE